MNDFDYKSLYSGIEPPPFAVGRLRTRIDALRADPFQDIVEVFRRRIAAGLAIALVLVAVLNLRQTDGDYTAEWNDYIGTSGVEQLASDLTDYTQTLE
jgi:hypothetical protein